MSTDPPGYYPPSEPVLVPPWLRDEPGELSKDVIDTRTRRVGPELPKRDPRESVFFPGRPPKHGDTLWRLTLADGRRVGIRGPMVLGRKPVAIALYPEAEMLPIDDPTKTVSKNHAVVIPHGDAIFVLDLHSMNGVAVVAGGKRIKVTSDEFTQVPEGAVVELGSCLLGAERAE